MTGLEKIKNQILEAAKKEAESILADANSKSEEITGSAKLEAEKIISDIRKKSASDIENYKNRVSSSNDFYRRTEVLKSKQTVIAEVIERAYQKICNLEPQAYFGMLVRMIGKYALSGNGEIFFSEKDLKTMPADFEEKVIEAAKAKGGTLTVSKEAKEIENGFVLRYGGVEENCTLRAIFDARREEFTDTVNALLYGKEA